MPAPLSGAHWTILIDPPTAPADGVQYIGYAQPNTSTAEDAWAILRLTFVSDDVSALEWAQGTNHPRNVWDDRATYTYS